MATVVGRINKHTNGGTQLETEKKNEFVKTIGVIFRKISKTENIFFRRINPFVYAIR